MVQWMLWKENGTVFLGLVKEKGCSFCLITLRICVSLEKLTLNGAHKGCKVWEGTLYLCMIFQAIGLIKLGKTALLAKIFF